MRHLVTGGAGQIGSAVARALLEAGHEVVVIDDLSTGARENLPASDPRLTLLTLDLNGPFDSLAPAIEGPLDTVLHFAALVGVERTLANPLRVLADLQGHRNVVRLARSARARRIVFASSSEVYGDAPAGPLHETRTPLDARLPYGVVKCAGEAFLAAAWREYGIARTVLRLFNVYGEAQTQDFVLPRFAAASVRGEPLKVRGDGLQTRSFCHVDDVVRVILHCALEDESTERVMNVGSADPITIRDLARLVIDRAGSSSTIEHVAPLPAGDCRHRCPDDAQLRATLGGMRITLEEGIDRVIGAARRRLQAAART